RCHHHISEPSPPGTPCEWPRSCARPPGANRQSVEALETQKRSESKRTCAWDTLTQMDDRAHASSSLAPQRFAVSVKLFLEIALLLSSSRMDAIFIEDNPMRMQLSHQAAERLGQSELVIITERVDDVAFLIGQMVKMGLPEVLDHHIPRHWTQRGLSWGWTAVMWLAYIVTEGDHRKVSMETYLKGMHHTLSRLTAQAIEPLDFSDDRLSHLLKHLSKKAYWHQIEQDLNARSIE